MSNWQPWTTAQEETLRELSFYGVAVVRDALAKRHGVTRSIRSIEAHASRIHVSLKVKTVCPQCGAVGVRINRQTGLCPRCSEEQHLAEEIAFNELLEAERKYAEDSPEVKEAERAYAKMRQRNARLCRRHGLRGKMDR